MKILVTGGAGGMGSHSCKHLTRTGTRWQSMTT